MTRLLVVRLGALGDLVHALPAVAALRRAHPDTPIDWLVDAVHRPFLDLVPIVSAIPLRERSAKAWLEVRTELRRHTYDAAIDFQGLLKSAALARLSGARRVLGFDQDALRERVAAPFYTEQVEVGEGGHVIQKNLRLAAALGAGTGVVEFPIRDMPSAALADIQAKGSQPFAIINGGAGWPNKRWPPDRFGRVAAWLRTRHGLRSIVLWGPGEEGLAGAIVSASEGAASLAPPTGIADILACARAAAIVVSGDTGPTHLAGAVGARIVSVFGPTNPARNGPWRAEDVVVSRYDGCECHYERRCRRDANAWCLATVSADDVCAAVDRCLGSYLTKGT